MLRDQISEGNFSSVMVFVLGFSELPNLQGLLFGLFFLVYIFILTGNGLIIIITRMDSVLQTPMYFFLANFSSLEICYVSVTPQDSNEPLDSRQKHFFTKLCHPNVLLPCSGCHRGIPSGSDGLWPLCVHLQPSALCIMRPVGCCCLAQWNSGPDKADMSGVLTAFLWFQPNPPPFLWHPPIDPAGLWGHCA